MNAVHGSILENIKLIEIIYEETVEAFKKDRTNTSDSKEVTVKQFIESYFPQDFQVKDQSKIYSKTQETNNIDCVILAPNHPRLITPKREVVLAEGVYAAIEVKPDISTLTEKSEFYRGLLQIKSVKNICRKVERLSSIILNNHLPYYDKIPSVIFSSKCSSLENIIEFISKKVREGKIGHEEIPDVIVSLDKGLISYSPIFKSTSLAKNYFNQDEYIPERAFTIYESNDKAEILILFLRYLLNFNAPYTLLTGFIVTDYLNDIKTNSFRIYNQELK